MKKRLIYFIAFFLFLMLSFFGKAIAIENSSLSEAKVHLFASELCPHCGKAKEFLLKLKSENPGLEIYHYNISYPSNSKLMSEIARSLGVSSGAVPFMIMGEEYLLGYSEAFNLDIIQKLEKSVDLKNQDFLASFIKDSGIIPLAEELEIAEFEIVEPMGIKDSNQSNQNEVKEESLNLAIFGDINLKKVSLPVLTLMIAFVDGFNPCAMWVLMFLISLLLGMKDRKRMWILGFTFIAASAFIYFLFMLAWLNLFLFIGLINWVRIIIGLVSIFIAYLYLKDFKKNKEGACEVDLGGKKEKIFAKLKEVSYRKSLILALLGIIVLAFAVNLLELVCSAGLPAVYTQLLSLTDLTKIQYYSYLLFYILIFMLDDMIIFTIAMTTLHRVGLSGKYARYSHLIGGILMLLLGLAMIFKPELIMFG